MTLRPSLLHAVADNPEPVPVPESTGEEAPVTPEPGRVNVAARAWRQAGRTWKEGARREGGWVNFALRWRGPSVDDQRDYLRGRSWLEEGHEGGVADWAGEAYHVGVAVPAVAILNGARAAVSRPFTGTWVSVVVLFLLFFPLRVAGLGTREAAAVCGCLALAPVAYIAVIALALAARRERQRKRGEKK